ncbi:4,5-DOPA dioxygenase extradiol [Flavihumibacter sp. UBA7668]|uniref:4,5-DOPA-extradiol-dioxygenase n=1 Tax=Flavihumibacter sp. UBA7668 TaxID=1946542 RepID=UPI0025BA1D65|nr:4,5-DOPA dioxygenase extradiol [Flavihumibacter sp. UBA7668]
MDSLQQLKKIQEALPENGVLMPLFFIGHGSPMNGIEDNLFSRGWKEAVRHLPAPRAVLVISAHWLTRGSFITAMDKPRTIHDFGGFPEALYQVQYAAPGDPVLAQETMKLVKATKLEADHEWGLDHGTWSVVRHMYPNANIPVLQLSIDYAKEAQWHYQLAEDLFELRKRGVLIIGSGNMVHNLRMVAWDKLNETNYGFDWAHQINDKMKTYIREGTHENLIQYQKMGKEALLAIPTPDHYYPLLYILGLQKGQEAVEFFNDQAVGGSLTMTSVKIG